VIGTDLGLWFSHLKIGVVGSFNTFVVEWGASELLRQRATESVGYILQSTSTNSTHADRSGSLSETVLKAEARTVEELPLEGYMFGYIDPAAGATIMQLIVAGTVGIGAVVKLKWHTIRKVFVRSNATVDDASEATLGVPDSSELPAESQG
jgi:hypothetical protein